MAAEPLSPPALPESPLDRRLPHLRQPANERPSDRVPCPRRERSQLPERTERKREPEHRPRRTREGIATEIRGVRLRPEERRLLAETGRFRVLNLKDVERTIYRGDGRALRTDLEYLRERGLVSVDSVAPRNDGHWLPQKRIEVVTLTKAGERLAHETSGFSQEQRLYHGLVKPREAEHDTQVYRAYLKEAERIEKAGGSNLRVELDFELKSKVQKAIHAAQKAGPERNMGEIKRQVAEQHDLPFVRNKIEIPDARIHYDEGSRTAFSDVEVVTAAYRPGHMQAKSQAGFRMYASASDRSRLATVEDEQHLLDWVMEL
ncbi:MAG TPA: hypothetical protein VHX60_04905 [Acidobacteriaceae bacterium]|jgi:hypothetical protein|nr:hypothetical protein [Acidobacteriaceae bacterium]